MLRVLLALSCVLAWVLLVERGDQRLPPRADDADPVEPPATALATTGIYARTRNPMYLSLAVLYVGIALMLDSWWPS